MKTSLLCDRIVGGLLFKKNGRGLWRRSHKIYAMSSGAGWLEMQVMGPEGIAMWQQVWVELRFDIRYFSHMQLPVHTQHTRYIINIKNRQQVQLRLMSGIPSLLHTLCVCVCVCGGGYVCFGESTHRLCFSSQVFLTLLYTLF